MRKSLKFSMSALLVVAVYCLDAYTLATANPGARNFRFEVSVGLCSWPDVEDLQSIVRGKLDKVHFNVAFAVHWPLKQTGNGDFLLGFDLALFPNKNNIIAGGGYLLPSVKWRPSENRNLSVDAGFGFYKVDFAEIARDAPLLGGTDIWKKNGFGGFFGGTWNIAATQRAKSGGLTFSFKVHFVDLGTMDGGDLLPPLKLGIDAGKLNRGFYQLQLGYHRE